MNRLIKKEIPDGEMSEQALMKKKEEWLDELRCEKVKLKKNIERTRFGNNRNFEEDPG